LGYILDKNMFVSQMQQFQNNLSLECPPLLFFVFKNDTKISKGCFLFFHGSFYQGEVLANEMQQRSTWKDS